MANIQFGGFIYPGEEWTERYTDELFRHVARGNNLTWRDFDDEFERSRASASKELIEGNDEGH